MKKLGTKPAIPAAMGMARKPLPIALPVMRKRALKVGLERIVNQIRRNLYFPYRREINNDQSVFEYMTLWDANVAISIRLCTYSHEGESIINDRRLTRTAK